MDSRLGSGNILTLELKREDIDALVDPDRRYSMNRFAGMLHGLQTEGWAPEDKAHIYLKQPEGREEKAQPVTLSLDPGGDLTYNLWMNDGLISAPSSYISDSLDDVVESDPSHRLHQLGITIIKVMYVNYLAEELRQTGQL
ncbi:hypothetical protein KC950_01400 [Candidatus Saccharibacteria bacterium]|nr:hypothetical protein [Candidatus Saccharibacteria bacterium]